MRIDPTDRSSLGCVSIQLIDRPWDAYRSNRSIVPGMRIDPTDRSSLGCVSIQPIDRPWDGRDAPAERLYVTRGILWLKRRLVINLGSLIGNEMTGKIGLPKCLPN
jgi:hypothetical protein